MESDDVMWFLIFLLLSLSQSSRIHRVSVFNEFEIARKHPWELDCETVEGVWHAIVLANASK